MLQASRRVPRVSSLVTALTVMVVLAACSSDSSPIATPAGAPTTAAEGAPTTAAPTPPSTRAAALRLPPSTVEELAPLFEPAVAPFGVRITRGSLADLDTRQYDPNGRHLALYVEPTTAWTDAQFVATIAPLTKALAPDLFQRWPDLESFDVCQEPFPGDSDHDEDASLTIVDMTREVSDSIDWDTVDLTALLVAAIERPGDMHLVAAEPLNQDPLFQQAQSDARARAGGADSPFD